MRIVATLLGAAALAALGAGRAPAGEDGAPSVLDVGDSLSVGTAPFLSSRLHGYRIVRIHDVGLHAEDVAEIVRERAAALPEVLVVSAGTNDDPRLVSRFSRSVEVVVAAAGSRRCVVWPNIVRPRAVGASYAGYNRVLLLAEARHDRLVIVDWASLVRQHSRWLATDGVHASGAGYRARAAAIAAAVAKRCSA